MKDISLSPEFKTISKDYKEWTLFLDRDGVINIRIHGNYVKNLEEFVFIKGVPEAISIFSKIFKYIFIVTNQQGIGKSYMTDSDLNIIHDYLIQSVEKAGGHINKIYYCSGLAKDNPPCRKPNIGMAIQAKIDFPNVDFAKSIMIGDSESDMLFAKNSGMYGIFLTDDPLLLPENIKTDGIISSLIDFANFIN